MGDRRAGNTVRKATKCTVRRAAEARARVLEREAADPMMTRRNAATLGDARDIADRGRGSASEALRELSVIARAWARTTPQEKRQVIAGLAKSIVSATDVPPVVNWYSPDEIARRRRTS